MKALNDAAVARARVVWNAAQVHPIGGVPASPLTPYLIISVDSGTAGHYSLAAEHGSSSHRLVAQAVGRTANEIAVADKKAKEAFLDHRFTVAGLDCSPCVGQVATGIIRDPDGGALLSSILTYTFITTEE